MDDKVVHQEVERLLTHHEIKDPMVSAKLDKLRAVVKNFAHGVIDVVPEGAERDQALLAVREAWAWAEAGVRLHQPVGGIPRISAARIDEATAVAMRDGKIPAPER